MKTSVHLILALSVGLLLVSDAAAIDSVKKIGNAPRISGIVRSVSPTEVTIEAAGSVQKIPVTEIEAVEFEGEANEMKLARSALKTGGDQNALKFLDTINPATVTKKEIKQDLAFYRAQAQARLALRGAGNVKNAGAEVFNFVNTNTDSYHFLQAQEILGELLVADGNVTAALTAFAVLDQSPFDEYKMRAGVARGRALMTQQKFPEAQAEFEKVLALPFNPMTQKGTPSESQRFAAVLGKAQCQANTQAYDEAIKELEGNVIPNLNVEESKLQAAAYNTLGNCYNQKPDGKKSALLAFLHVDVLYRMVPSEHAEALYNLGVLWEDLGKTERAQEARTTLNRLYPGSSWAAKKP
jgi:tetratricopeptide (TPR) repeat protein